MQRKTNKNSSMTIEMNPSFIEHYKTKLCGLPLKFPDRESWRCPPEPWTDIPRRHLAQNRRCGEEYYRSQSTEIRPSDKGNLTISFLSRWSFRVLETSVGPTNQPSETKQKQGRHIFTKSDIAAICYCELWLQFFYLLFIILVKTFGTISVVNSFV